MYKNIIGSYAEKIEDIPYIISRKKIKNITTTPYYKRELLHEIISEKLDIVEKNTELQLYVLNNIKELVSRTPSDSKEKEVYEFRLENLYNLYYISNEIKEISTQKSKYSEKLERKVIELDALLQVSNNSPLRNLLEDEMKKLKSAIGFQQKEKVCMGNMVTLINNAQSEEEIDEILCEIFIEEYVNLGKENRQLVSKQFFNLSKFYNSSIEIIEEISKLISNLDKIIHTYQYNKEKSEAKLAINDEFYKQTIDIKEFKKILREF